MTKICYKVTAISKTVKSPYYGIFEGLLSLIVGEDRKNSTICLVFPKKTVILKRF